MPRKQSYLFKRYAEISRSYKFPGIFPVPKIPVKFPGKCPHLKFPGNFATLILTIKTRLISLSLYIYISALLLLALRVSG